MVEFFHTLNLETSNITDPTYNFSIKNIELLNLQAYKGHMIIPIKFYHC